MLMEPDGIRALFVEQKQLDTELALRIIRASVLILKKEKNIVDLSAPVNVCGDIHGQFFDLLNLLDMIGPIVEDNKVLFLGDYVDRGDYSCEVILYLLSLKIKYPTLVYLLRGNHESEPISTHYGFRAECEAKYGVSLYYHFLSAFEAMPVGALLNTNYGRLLALHGGLSPSLRSLSAIQNIPRLQEVDIGSPLCDLLWSDPLMDDISSPAVVTMHESETETETADEGGGGGRGGGG